MENIDKKCECGEGMCKNACQGGSCGNMQYMYGCHGRKHYLVKMILKIIIVALIFWCGFKLGEITGFIKSEYGRGMMQRGGYGYGMMRGGYDYINDGSISPLK